MRRGPDTYEQTDIEAWEVQPGWYVSDRHRWGMTVAKVERYEAYHGRKWINRICLHSEAGRQYDMPADYKLEVNHRCSLPSTSATASSSSRLPS